MIKHHIQVSFEKSYHSLICCILVSFFNEIVKSLGAHKLFHKRFILSFKLHQVVIEIKNIYTWKLIIN